MERMDFTIGEIETYFALGYITVISGGEIEIIKKEQDDELQ
jgi:hypothetical protein